MIRDYKTVLYNDIKNKIATITEIKDFNWFRNQLRYFDDQESDRIYSFPAVFIEFSTDYNQASNLGSKNIKQAQAILTVHIIAEEYDFEFEKMNAISNKVHLALQGTYDEIGQQATDPVAVYGPLDLQNFDPDTDFVSYIDWQLTYSVTIEDQIASTDQDLTQHILTGLNSTMVIKC